MTCAVTKAKHFIHCSPHQKTSEQQISGIMVRLLSNIPNKQENRGPSNIVSLLMGVPRFSSEIVHLSSNVTPPPSSLNSDEWSLKYSAVTCPLGVNHLIFEGGGGGGGEQDLFSCPISTACMDSFFDICRVFFSSTIFCRIFLKKNLTFFFQKKHAPPPPPPHISSGLRDSSSVVHGTQRAVFRKDHALLVQSWRKMAETESV